MKIQSNKKVQMASTFLGLVLLGAFIANQQSLGRIEDEVKPGSREPASQGSTKMASLSRQAVDENKLAEQVAMSHSRGIASVATAASDFDSLRFGILEGKYDFKMEGQVISEITLPEHAEQPSVIQNRQDFLKQFSEQFGAQTAPKKVSSVLKDDHLIERYLFENKDASKNRIIELTIGESNTLLHLKTDKAPTLKLF